MKAPKAIPQRDHYARLLYMIQASQWASVETTGPLGRHMARQMKLTAQKGVLKLLPHVKRAVCKKCHQMLVPGLSMVQRIENDSTSKAHHNDVLVHECVACGTSKRYPIGKNRDYVLFADECVVGIGEEAGIRQRGNHSDGIDKDGDSNDKNT